MNPIPRPFWPPLLAGAALGAAILAAFLLTGHALDFGGLFARAGADLFAAAAPGWAAANAVFEPYLEGAAGAGWQYWGFAGLLIGALTGSLTSGRFRLLIERGAGLRASHRLGWAFGGGIVAGLGVGLAQGGVAGIGLSGGATLTLSALVFLAAFFVAGFAVMPLLRRKWQ